MPQFLTRGVVLRLILGFAVLIAALTIYSFAHAADLPARNVTKAPATQIVFGPWSGLYGGIQGGYAYDVGNVVANDGKDDVVEINQLTNSPAAGWTAGGRLGYDWNAAPFVFGIVTELNYANFSGSISGSDGNASGNANFKTNWWGATNARLGLSQFGNHVLPYVIGGLAYGDRQLSLNVGNGISTSNTAIGWDAGVGVSVRMSQATDLFAEAKYVDLGTLDDTSGTTGLSKAFRFGVVEGGLNFHF